ncbi:type II toxin-antitoxin system VapB family antitoxin [Glycomyces tritici]|uniref:Type II toxin-antitoxin system VapB family antitoxin n=1 Tax=Glycomyces tritici TaxID=2665176 RepID=A0ABT7YL15_9ACTN|nr:type II toxin-antitoxin system VapB family antitoxin [Glycomyces tritici]MDN3239280.1 type II toxin-antitoxin system VapB family antitoxin [Glycomyces tritici]
MSAVRIDIADELLEAAMHLMGTASKDDAVNEVLADRLADAKRSAPGGLGRE